MNYYDCVLENFSLQFTYHNQYRSLFIMKEFSLQVAKILSIILLGTACPISASNNLSNFEVDCMSSELCDRGELIPSEKSEKSRYEKGLAEQLRRVIRKMDGVKDAAVSLSIPSIDLFLGEASSEHKITASIDIKYSPLIEDPKTNFKGIKQLMVSSVCGLREENVEINFYPDKSESES